MRIIMDSIYKRWYGYTFYGVAARIVRHTVWRIRHRYTAKIRSTLNDTGGDALQRATANFTFYYKEVRWQKF